jgi:hypothetical protein
MELMTDSGETDYSGMIIDWRVYITDHMGMDYRVVEALIRSSKNEKPVEIVKQEEPLEPGLVGLAMNSLPVNKEFKPEPKREHVAEVINDSIDIIEDVKEKKAKYP